MNGVRLGHCQHRIYWPWNTNLYRDGIQVLLCLDRIVDDQFSTDACSHYTVQIVLCKIYQSP